MNINFIGVGAIGLPMALQIQRAGHQVTGVDVAENIVAQAREHGLPAILGMSNAPTADLVVVMVATPDQLAMLVGHVHGGTRVSTRTG
jgi:3-hydroxyisobutyrate dehydrogenase/putative dehydrogenase